MERSTGSLHLNRMVLVLLIAMLAVGQPAAASATGPLVFLPLVEQTASTGIYWGAEVNALDYGQQTQPPLNFAPVATFEAHAGKAMSVLHFEERWQTDGVDDEFVNQQMDIVRQHGAIPMLDWISADNSVVVPDSNRPSFALANIIDGSFDAYIHTWASEAAAWGYPFFLRFDYEMNGDWTAWSEGVNGNQSGQYVQAWRHVHDIFTQVGATNVTWVWCPNVLIPPQPTTPMQSLYPGEAYVDWTCLDGYNWGTNPTGGAWMSFQQVFSASYQELLNIAPGKPVMIGETSSSENGGSKAAWITDALTVQLPSKFPAIKAVLWLNANVDGQQWVIESSPQAQAAFAAGLQSSYYRPNQYGNIDKSPIPPP